MISDLSIRTLGTKISLNSSPFYKEDVLKPFINAYIYLKPNDSYILLGKYNIGHKFETSMPYRASMGVDEFFVFLGYVFQGLRFHPFFLQLAGLRKHDPMKYTIIGYAIEDSDEMKIQFLYQDEDTLKFKTIYENKYRKYTACNFQKPEKERIYSIIQQYQPCLFKDWNFSLEYLNPFYDTSIYNLIDNWSDNTSENLLKLGYK